MDIIKMIDKDLRNTLKNMYYKTEGDILYKQFLHGFKLILDLASHDLGVIRIEASQFYVSIEQLDKLMKELRQEIKKLRGIGIVE